MKTYFIKIKSLLALAHKRELIGLILLLFVGMFFEILGIGILLPILKIILEPQVIDEIISEFGLVFLSDLSYKRIVAFSLALIVFIYLVRTIFLVFVNYKQNSLLERIRAYLSLTLYKKYLYQSYLEHQYRDISDIIKNIQIEVIYFRTFLNGLVLLVVEFSLILSIFVTILFIEPRGAVTLVLFFGVLSAVYFQFTKKRIRKWGDLRQNLDGKVSKNIIDSLTGIKELKLYGSEPYFVEDITLSLHQKVKIETKQNTLSQVPRFYLEMITIMGLVVLILTLFSAGQDSTDIIATLGVFVASAFRMIPSLNRILNSLQNIKYHGPSVDKIHTEIKRATKSDELVYKLNELIQFQGPIKVEGICFSYEKTPVLSEISLNIDSGETIGIIGESGSGKSTFADILSGLIRPISGRIMVNSKDIHKHSKSWKKQLGYVGQEVFIIDENIRTNVAFGIQPDQIDEKRVIDVLHAAQLSNLIDNLPMGIDTRVGERGMQLSGGQRQRIGIARALYHNPKVLIFDEATAALDTQTEEEVMKSIYNLRKDKTIIIIAHRMSTLRKCDRIFEIKKSKMFQKKIQWEKVQ